jgi:hypothetical protein
MTTYDVIGRGPDAVRCERQTLIIAEPRGRRG